MAAHGRIELASWSKRSPEFGKLLYHDASDTLVMEVRPSQHADSEAWDALQECWLHLPYHPNLLEAIDRGAGGALLVTYAALDWEHAPLAMQWRRQAVASLRAWTTQIIEVFAMIARETAKSDWRRLLRPFVKIDLRKVARVGFLPVVAGDEQLAAKLPPEALRRRGRVDERSLVYVVGALLRDLAAGLQGPDAEAAHEVIARCVQTAPEKRFRRVRDLQRAWTALHEPEPMPGALELDSWWVAEEAVGWLALGKIPEARSRFERASRLDPGCGLAREWLGLDADFIDTGPTAGVRARASGGAPSIPTVEEPLVRARAHLAAKQPAEALRCADSWIASHALEASGHYVRGRALFALGRFEEARAAFDRASALDPRMIEAMLLRREADKAMRRVREMVGTQPDIHLDLPERLSEVRDALAAGRGDELLRLLERDVYASDPDAQLLRARCLAFERRLDEAVAIFERVAELSPTHAPRARLGRALALLSLERASEALSLLDELRAATPGDLEVLEARAIALRQLGRTAEADDEQRRVVTASGGRSDLRIGRAR